ncbi:MAG: hypothetical protein K0Q57_245 [Gammaproteobacteria bacterium]|jgi:YfiH family protein|nr:hypothetical protein [Gammaproteobacteria bacterium]
MALIIPEWPAPKHIRAYCTSRSGGVSTGPYASLNLGDHVGDQPGLVQQNRQLLYDLIGLRAEPHWLKQVHGKDIKLITSPYVKPVDADAAITSLKNQACIIMTADCLPILLCDQDGDAVAAIHAGWRGLAAGVIQDVVTSMPCPTSKLLAWFGPAISQAKFEVGGEVYDAFGELYQQAFKSSQRKGHYMADLYHIAKIQLEQLGVTAIYGGEHCTYSDPQFYSYRRDKGVTGRMASLIWINEG